MELVFWMSKPIWRNYKALKSDLSLANYDPNKDIYIVTDASNLGFGAVLLHKEDNTAESSIPHIKNVIADRKKNYSQIEKEALSILFAVKKKFHKFLHGRNFILQTDHRPLLSIFGFKKGIQAHTANWLQRWGTILLNYRFKMEFIP